MNSPSVDVEVDVVDRGDLAEDLADALETDVGHELPRSPAPTC